MTKKIPDGMEPCPNCDGCGFVRVHYGDCDVDDCPYCKGTGLVYIDRPSKEDMEDDSGWWERREARR